jgi:MFS family permease
MHNEHFNKNKVRLVSFMSFLLGFLDAFLIYILSAYFSQATGSNNVGVFYFVAYSGVLFSLFYLQPLIRAIGKARTLYLGLGITILASVLLTRVSIAWFSVGVVLIFIVATNLVWVTLDILLESFSQDRISGRIRGLYLTIMNAGLLAAPFLSTLTLTRYHYEGVFFVLVIGYMIVFLIALIGFCNDNVVFQEKISLRQTLIKITREKNIFRIYHISFAMEFFYAMMIVYTPLYLRSLDFAWNEIGIIFTIMLLPFVFLQYPLGVLADKRWGEKELLIGSIIITAAVTFALGFFGKQTLFVWAAALFLTRIGIAGIEVLRDSYFYKQVDGDSMDIIAFFRTARPLANILGALFSAILLLYFPLKSIFFLTTLVLFLSLFSAFALKDTQSEREIRA